MIIGHVPEEVKKSHMNWWGWLRLYKVEHTILVKIIIKIAVKNEEDAKTIEGISTRITENDHSNQYDQRKIVNIFNCTLEEDS